MALRATRRAGAAFTRVGLVAAAAATLSAHGSRAVAEQTTKDLVANKRRAYQGGCISKAAYLKFLDEAEAAIKAYKCPACVAAFDAERARVG